MLVAGVLAALILGAVITVLATSGGDHKSSQGPGSPAARHGTVPRLGRRGDLAVAVAYLGLAPAQLLDALRSGKTLAQVARVTRGRSVAGLIDRIVAARKAALAQAVASGGLTSAQERAALIGVRARVTVRVNRVGGYPSAVGRRSPAAPAAAAAYLGISQAQLRAELRSGKTLAQLASGTGGKSAGGLIAAIVADTKARLAAAVAAGSLTPASQKLLLANLDRRVATEVNGG
jgi:hypothetical protein